MALNPCCSAWGTLLTASAALPVVQVFGEGTVFIVNRENPPKCLELFFLTFSSTHFTLFVTFISSLQMKDRRRGGGFGLLAVCQTQIEL